MKLSGIILLLTGIFLLGYSLTLKPYTNEDEYNKKYSSIDADSKNSFEEFHKLREIYLTNKYSLENYGLTIFILGVCVLLLFFKGWKEFKTPRYKTTVGVFGLLAVFLTVSGYVGSLVLEMYRGSYPHWADSIGIGLMEVPGMFLILFCWFGINLIGLTGNFKTKELVYKLGINQINYWYAIILLFTIILTGICIIEGDFLFTLAGMTWSYFYLALLVGRRAGKVETSYNQN